VRACRFAIQHACFRFHTLWGGEPDTERAAREKRGGAHWEDVRQTGPVRREEARVEREPITEKAGCGLTGPDISEAERQVTLHEEPAAET
jgi:hypothetical protein